MALLEYALILYLKNMSGVSKSIGAKSKVLAITPTKNPDLECWTNQETETQETRLKRLDFVCLIAFPIVFVFFNIIYWTYQSTRILKTTIN